MSDEYRATDQLTRLVAAAEIGRLVWIDDQFGKDASRLARTLATKITTLWALSDGVGSRHPQLQGIAVGSDPAHVESELLKLLEASGPDSNLAEEFFNSIDDQIADIDPTHTAEVRDLSTRQFQEIRSAFADAGAEVVTLSYAHWVSGHAAICAQLKTSDLFFVDHDFSSEEGADATTGETILKTLFQQRQQIFTCILFTHGTGIEEQKSTRDAIAGRLGLGATKHRFSVVSKESITASEAESGYNALSVAFKEAFLSDWCYSIAEKSREIFDESFRETADVLLSLSVGDVAAAFFRKPFKDGTSEFDVLLRIFMLSARVKLEDKRHSETFMWERLGAIRRVLSEPPFDTVRSPTNRTLQQWHEREIFDPAEIVNALFSPVFLGDLFEVQTNKGSEYYVLVEQTCDLSIRDTGHRANTEARFLPVTEEAPPNTAFGYEFEFPTLGSRWIRYGGSFAVNLNLLDLVSFRNDGKMTFTLELVKSNVMLPGVRKRFDKLMASFMSLYNKNGERTASQIGAKYQRLALSGLPFLITSIDENKRISFPIARVGRIRSPHAEAILAGLAIYHTRVAFDYNFADLSAYSDAESRPAG